MTCTLLGISGSLRRESHNRLLVREAARVFGADGYVEADIDLPLYNGDVENTDGIPKSVQRLAEQIAKAGAIAISSPEYNGAVSGVLKNALDWVSRVKGNPWRDKPLAIMSAAAGRAGGARTQFALRHCLVPFRPRLVPGPELMVARSAEEFDDAGRLKSELYLKTLTELMDGLRAEAEAAAKIAA